MDTDFRLFPEQASTHAAEIDQVFFYVISVTVFFSALIFFLVLFFCARYRRRPGNETGGQVKTSRALEITWIVIPLVLVLIMFFWGARVFFPLYRPPSNALDVYVVGRQWMWKLQHAEGAPEINELHVPLGRPIRLTMTSQDVIHSFFVPAFRVKHDVLPGRYTTIWFQPTKVGEFHLFCAEYCGTKHSGMVGRVVVLTPADYERWLERAGSQGSLASGGQRLFLSLGCATCHTEGPGAQGPNLVGVYGSRVRLQGGEEAVADESYLRESILDPAVKVVAGFQPVMPAFRGKVTEEELIQLIAFLKARSGPAQGSRDP
jgi:cytochrome c oxidase subunit 2